MSLANGTTLGPYRISMPLGAGGMGEVYRAHDTRLNRDVAIKVLPAAVTGDPDRRTRFEREARAIAALSHPNILAIHDVGADGETAYVVTELLDGETLRERLTNGEGLPARKAIDIGIQIARGLAAAHAKGIVHRDLKPENVFLLADGQVKILDFGLARQTQTPLGSGATETVAATDPGTVLGTVGYMAPEQVRGAAIDARTDLFALGAVLYEMLTGRRAFRRDTAAETMTAILKDEPPAVTSVRADLPPALERIVSHCLEKNPVERFQSARDVAFALEALTGATTSGTSALTPVRRVGRGVWTAAALAAGIALGLIGGWRLFANAAVPVQFDSKTWEHQAIWNARFAPDGQTIVFSGARSGNTPSLFVLRPDSVLPQPIGPPDTELLAMSSKGEIAVLTDAKYLYHRIFSGTLARMTLDGSPRPWLEDVHEADWAPDGSTVAIVHVVNGKDQLEYPIGQVLHSGTGYLSDPRISPTGDAVAFVEHPISADDRGFVAVVDRSGHTTKLTEEYSALQGLAWSLDGRELYFSASPDQGYYQPYVVEASGRRASRQAFSTAGHFLVFDLAGSSRLLGTRQDTEHNVRGLAPGASTDREIGWLSFPVKAFFSGDGRLAAFTDLSPSAGADYQVALRHMDGSGVVRLGPGGALAFSSDGKQVLAIVPSTRQLWLYPTGAGAPTKLDRGPITGYRYVGQWFQHDERILACGSTASGVSRCYQQRVAGGPPTSITEDNVTLAMLASDEKAMLLQTGDGEYRLSELGSTTSRHAPGFNSTDRALNWGRDNRSFYVQVGLNVPMQIDRIDTVTGSRTRARELAPPDLSGVANAGVDQWDDDGRVYTYRYGRVLSTLFVVSHVR